MSELITRPGPLAAVGGIHVADLTQDEKLLLTTYRALCNDLQEFCLDIAVNMAKSSRRRVRPALKVIEGGAA